MKIEEFLNVNHGNFSARSEEFLQFIKETVEAGELKGQKLAGLKKSDAARFAFIVLSIKVVSLPLSSDDRGRLFRQFFDKYGTEYFAAALVNFRIFLNGLQSYRATVSRSILGSSFPVVVEGARSSLYELEKMSSDYHRCLSDRFDDCFAFSGSEELSRIGILVDDLSPLKTNTLTKMVMDLVKVLLENTDLKIYIFSSKLHSPGHQFWLPSVHQTKQRGLKALFNTFEMGKYLDRVQLHYLNDMFYGGTSRKFILDAFITYPERHNFAEKYIYERFPVVEVEILSGMSKVQFCDVVVPNGIPSQELLKTFYSKIAVVIPPRVKYLGAGDGNTIDYLESGRKIIVTVAKAFDIRSEFDRDPFFAKVAEFLKKNKEFSWVFVGGSDSLIDYICSEHKDLHDSKQIIIRSFEMDLPALFSRASICVHPPIVGGGRTPSIAFENHCPVVTFDFGDCTKYVPTELQRGSVTDVFDLLETFCKDPEARASAIELGVKAVSGSVNREAVIGYVAALRRASAKFADRAGLSLNAKQSNQEAAVDSPTLWRLKQWFWA